MGCSPVCTMADNACDNAPVKSSESLGRTQLPSYPSPISQHVHCSIGDGWQNLVESQNPLRLLFLAGLRLCRLRIKELILRLNEYFSHHHLNQKSAARWNDRRVKPQVVNALTVVTESKATPGRYSHFHVRRRRRQEDHWGCLGRSR